MQYFKPDTNNVGLVEFKNTYPVSTDVLDLAVLIDEGACAIDLAREFEHPVHLTDGWRLRANAVVNKAEAWRSRLNEYNGPLSEIADEAVRNVTHSSGRWARSRMPGP